MQRDLLRPSRALVLVWFSKRYHETNKSQSRRNRSGEDAANRAAVMRGAQLALIHHLCQCWGNLHAQLTSFEATVAR